MATYTLHKGNHIMPWNTQQQRALNQVQFLNPHPGAQRIQCRILWKGTERDEEEREEGRSGGRRKKRGCESDLRMQEARGFRASAHIRRSLHGGRRVGVKTPGITTWGSY
eukprot:185355-Hanusia_phi.AAC.8